ncbi:hypothetical protein MMC16_004390 [Acarospora aff. strigata]|nr:hypothetical protein [Acarospora aff. strigata]
MALCILPIELSHAIAGLLDTDRDVCNYMSVCRGTYSAIGNQPHIWRKRFLQCFDLLPDKSTAELELKYKLRRRILRRGAIFSFGHEFQERLCLDIIKELVVESFGQVSHARGCETKTFSKNLQVVHRFVKSTNLLDDIFRFPPEKGAHNPLLIMVQLLFTHCSLDPNLACETYSFAYSQKAVYGHPEDFPMFLDKHMRHINTEYLLHIANFFKYHMIRSEEHTLYHDVLALADEEKPIAWAERLENGTKQLGKHWMGSYAFPEDPIEYIRASEPTDHVFLDVFDNEEGFQTLELNFNPSEPICCGADSDAHLRSILSFSHHHDQPLNNPAQKNLRNAETNQHKPPASSTGGEKPRYLNFEGSGFDRDHFHCAGHLHALPPQHGIPGWQRITLMKYALDDHGFCDPGSCWAYEGIVLPGRQIILGRWWSPLHSEGDGGICGPFIFWNVRGPDGESAGAGAGESPADSGCFVGGEAGDVGA